MQIRLQGAILSCVILTFQFLFSCSVGKIILKQTNNLGKCLQNPSVSAAQGHEIAHILIVPLWKDRSDEKRELLGAI